MLVPQAVLKHVAPHEAAAERFVARQAKPILAGAGAVDARERLDRFDVESERLLCEQPEVHARDGIVVEPREERGFVENTKLQIGRHSTPFIRWERHDRALFQRRRSRARRHNSFRIVIPKVARIARPDVTLRFTVRLNN